MIFFRILAILALILFGIGFFGAVHPFFDSMSIGRPLAAFAAFVFSWSLWRPFNFVISGGLAIWLAFFASTFLPSKAIEDSNLSLYQHNLLFTSTAPDLQLVGDQLHPDFMTLQEIRNSRDTIKNIEGYQNQIICEFEAVGDTAILSRHPFIDKGCALGGYRGFAWARVDINGSPITIVSLHLHWPYPFGQRSQINELLPQLEALPRPIILGGDFNQTNWSYNLKSIAKAVDGRPERNTIITLNRFPLFLPIDHVISPFPMSIQKLNRYGSDHNALLAKFRTP